MIEVETGKSTTASFKSLNIWLYTSIWLVLGIDRELKSFLAWVYSNVRGTSPNVETKFKKYNALKNLASAVILGFKASGVPKLSSIKCIISLALETPS